MGNGDTSQTANERSPEGEVEWKPVPQSPSFYSDFSSLINRALTPRLALDADDPLEGCDDTVRRIAFGRKGEASGRPRTRQDLSDISSGIFGHAVPFMQVHSERAPNPPDGDDTAVDEEWDARVMP